MKQLKKVFLLIFISMVFLACKSDSTTESGGWISTTTLLNDMVNREQVARFPEANFRLKQHSSYNRASKTPMDSVGWYNNHDFNSKDEDVNFIRIEEYNGEQEWVLMDHQGPGALVRTWMPFETKNTPETDIQINIYLDGATEPTLSGNMLGIFNGTGLFPFPLAHKSLRSAVSFFPIPYAKSCKITTDKQPFFFQFTFREYDAEAKIKTFTMKEFNESQELIGEVCKTLLDHKNNIEGNKVSFSENIKPNEEQAIDLPNGNAAIKLLSVKLDDYSNDEITRKVLLKIEFDGMQTVWSPIGDFFGTGIGLNPFKSWYTTVEENGTMSSRWVMPYQKSGKISIVNLNDTPINVTLDATVGDWTWDTQSMYFNAAWKGQYPVATRPYSDWNYVTLKGKGVYVGDALTVMNPVKRWWGEGDEKIWVDGEDFPSIFGTGTEDYYAYSWGGVSNDFYEHPFHGQPHSYIYDKLNMKPDTDKEKNTSGYSTEFRSRSLDGMPFSSSLQLDMEVWSWTDCDMGYGVGVYWYGDANTTSNRFPDNQEVLNVPPLPEGFPNVE